jgi:peroxiredoxin
LQQVLGQIVAHDATLVALTPQLPEHSRGMIAKQLLGYELLSDPGNAYAAKLGLRFALPDDLRAVYTARGLDLPKHNGDPSWTLPMPGRFVIDRAGVARSVDVDPDYTRRPEPEKTLGDLAAVNE